MAVKENQLLLPFKKNKWSKTGGYPNYHENGGLIGYYPECSFCRGYGYNYGYDSDHNYGPVDCPHCDGLGFARYSTIEYPKEKGPSKKQAAFVIPNIGRRVFIKSLKSEAIIIKLNRASNCSISGRRYPVAVILIENPGSFSLGDGVYYVPTDNIKFLDQPVKRNY